MMYTKKAVQAIKFYRDRCSKKEDISKLICNIIMPEWDNIINELGSIDNLERILHNLLNDVVNYTKPILQKFQTYKNYNKDMVPCYSISIH